MRGLICMLQDAAQAEEALAQSVAMSKEMRDHTIEATSSFGFGWLAFYGGRWDEAEERIDRAAQIFREQGMVGHAVEVRFYSAICALLRGDLEAFKRILSWIEDPELVRGGESRYPRIWALRGVEHLLANHPSAARKAYARALHSGRMQWACTTNLLYGAVLGAMGKPREASRYSERARDLARAYRWTLPALGMPAIESRLLEVLRTATRASNSAIRQRSRTEK
jgi:tetratricopeptide (TPR) repeat protein